MEILFDDESKYDIEIQPDIRRAFNLAFGKHEPVRIEILLTAAVDRFWTSKKIPTERGELIPWSRSYSNKADLGDAVLRAYLYYQIKSGTGDIEKFTFKVGNEGTMRALRGQAALKAANDFSRAYLFGFGKQGILESAMAQLAANQQAEARDTFEAVTNLDPDDGTAHFWLAILLQREGNSERAKPLFRKAAEQLSSPYLDRAACPKCGWIPSGEAMWKCEGCKESVDIFEGHGECPKCKHKSPETKCVACGKQSPHSEWWNVK